MKDCSVQSEINKETNKKLKKGNLLFLTKLFLLLLIVIFTYSYYLKINNGSQNETIKIDLPKNEQIEIVPLDKKAVLAFVGDIMLDRSVYNKIRDHGGGDFNYIFKNIKDDLLKYDFLVGNLEGPISDKGADRYDLYSFRMKPEALDALRNVGFDGLSVANNHINNWGTEAMEDTFLRLKESGIKVLGGGFNDIDASYPKIVEINGTKIAFLAFSQFDKGKYEATASSSGIVIISEGALKGGIKIAKENADLVVVIFHFGDEYAEESNSYQKKYSHLAIDLGANLVVGHHPHVVEEVEIYSNSYIAYSLGNFVFDQYFSKETMEGGLLEVTVQNKKIIDVKLQKIQMNKNYQPEIVR
jgi:poly-gamma-glutamate capsule biosynthesis protein CapA/YwtB (metallophosphatase superfamily)